MGQQGVFRSFQSLGLPVRHRPELNSILAWMLDEHGQVGLPTFLHLQHFALQRPLRDLIDHPESSIAAQIATIDALFRQSWKVRGSRKDPPLNAVEQNFM